MGFLSLENMVTGKKVSVSSEFKQQARSTSKISSVATRRYQFYVIP